MHGGREKLRKLVLGLKQVGSRHDAPYDRVTGAGFVAAYNGGQYAATPSPNVQRRRRLPTRRRNHWRARSLVS